MDPRGRSSHGGRVVAVRGVDDEREELLEHVSALLDRPMTALSVVWLVVVALQLAGRTDPALDFAATGLWVLFVAHFVLELIIAPKKGLYLRRNWLTVVALAVPALRVFRIGALVPVLRSARALRGLRLATVIGGANRGLRTARKVLQRRHAAFVGAVYVVVLLLGAGGMYALEGPPEGGLPSYGEALWWTAMQLTTLGAPYSPVTAEGRVLSLLLAIFAFTLWGYVTATLASLFVQQDRDAGADP